MSKFNAPLQPDGAWLKAGFYGKTGAGKTWTALKIAQGLVARERAARRTDPRIFIGDTERGAKHYLRQFTVYGPPPGSRRIQDVHDMLADACLPQQAGSVIVLDSMSDYWDERKNQYHAQNKTDPNRKLPPQAWDAIKKPWHEMMAALIAAPCHVIYCGRLGTEVDEVEDQHGNAKAVWIRYKMKAEADTLHQADLCVRFEQANKDNLGVSDPKRLKKLTDPNKIVHLAIVEKDRSQCLQGETLVNPDWDDFVCVVEALEKSSTTPPGSPPPPQAAPAPASPPVPPVQPPVTPPPQPQPTGQPDPALAGAIATLEASSNMKALKAAWESLKEFRKGLTKAQLAELESTKEDLKHRFETEALPTYEPPSTPSLNGPQPQTADPKGVPSHA